MQSSQTITLRVQLAENDAFAGIILDLIT